MVIGLEAEKKINYVFCMVDISKPGIFHIIPQVLNEIFTFRHFHIYFKYYNM